MNTLVNILSQGRTQTAIVTLLIVLLKEFGSEISESTVAEIVALAITLIIGDSVRSLNNK